MKPPSIAVADLALGDTIRTGRHTQGTVTALATSLTGPNVMGYDLRLLHLLVQVDGSWRAYWPHDTIPAGQ